MHIDWTMVSALATAVYGVAFVASILLVLHQLRQQSNETFVSGTASAFDIWEDDGFQRAIQWVLYDLKEQTWREFEAAHKGDYGERALVRVGGFYNRIGYLVSYKLLGKNDRILLDTVAGSAIAVWRKIEPLVLEARLIENSTMFQDFERMLPECHECYVPLRPDTRSPSRQEGAPAG
ncbi:MAG: DUF4760 domain-containing protein [Chloroflexota bacterium]